MNNLLTAIMSKLSGTALDTAVGSRIYLDEAPELTVFPYAVLRIVASTPEDTFTDELEDTLLQVSLYSTSAGATEITGLYANLKAALKNAVLTVTGGTNIWLEQRALATMLDEIVTPEGTVGCRHWAVDFSILVQAT